MNKVTLVTGGSRGLGQNMATELAQQGHDVIITYNSNRTAAEQVVDSVKSHGSNAAALQLDVTKLDMLDKFVENFASTLQASFGTDKFDYLVNNAGMGVHAVRRAI